MQLYISCNHLESFISLFLSFVLDRLERFIKMTKTVLFTLLIIGAVIASDEEIGDHHNNNEEDGSLLYHVLKKPPNGTYEHYRDSDPIQHEERGIMLREQIRGLSRSDATT